MNSGDNGGTKPLWHVAGFAFAAECVTCVSVSFSSAGKLIKCFGLSVLSLVLLQHIHGRIRDHKSCKWASYFNSSSIYQGYSDLCKSSCKDSFNKTVDISPVVVFLYSECLLPSLTKRQLFCSRCLMNL